MNTRTALMMMAASITLMAAPAEAARFAYQITGSYQASFTVDSDDLVPPADVNPTSFTVFDTPGTFGGQALTARSVTFNTTMFDGGLTIELPDNDFRSFLGPQLFSGTTALPTLLTGVFMLKSDFDEAPVTLTVTQAAAAVPEPATWMMLIVGFGAVGVAMRRRNAAQTAVRTA